MNPFHHNTARTNKAVVFNNGWCSLQWFQNTSNSYSTTKMHITTNLGARTNCSPSIHHSTTSNPSANIDIRRHHDYPFFQESTFSSNSVRNYPNTFSGVVFFQRNFIMKLKRPNINRFHFLNREIK